MYRLGRYNTNMNRKFKKRTLPETLRLICIAKGGEFLWSGKPNSSHLARLVGERQPTVNRWLTGVSSPTSDKIDSLCKALKLTPSQIMGYEPIDYVDGPDAYMDENERFLKRFPQLSENAKKAILYQMALELDQSDKPESEH